LLTFYLALLLFSIMVFLFKIYLSSKQLRHNYEMHKPSLQKRLSKAEFQLWKSRIVADIINVESNEHFNEVVAKAIANVK